MKRYLRLFVLIPSLCILFGCSRTPDWDTPWTLSQLEIEISGASREISFTNTQAGFYYTETHDDHRSSWQGWHVSSRKIMSDYEIALDDETLDRKASSRVRVWPHEFTRSYHDHIRESFLFLDSVDAFIVTLEDLPSRYVSISPQFDLSARVEDIMVTDGHVLILSPFSSEMRADRPDVPAWIGIAGSKDHTTVSGSIRTEGGRIYGGHVRQAIRDGKARFIIAAAHTQKALQALLEDISEAPESLRSARIVRMESLLNDSYVRTSDERFDKALAWAKLSMDALIMEQGRKGIFAGLPWFSNYWGRDTFISLPGAALATGRYSEAREILRSFAQWQNTDPESIHEGRIPNLVTPTSIAYNTTDGTPWFVNSVYAYVVASGDTAFAREMYPVVQRAADGPLRHRTDPHGFLLHDDAETWMDAVGPEGPWSPRGNRANDVQALWYTQLSRSSSLASLLKNRSDTERWALAADDVSSSFRTMFVSDPDSLIYDHLNADGTPDRSVRPNQLYALDLIGDESLRARVFARLTEELVYEHGVGSLSMHDESFHPYHHVEPLYVQDAAYHNGIVWTWQNGAWIEHAVRSGLSDLAFTMTQNMVHQILDRGAVGTISELLDAAPREGEQEPRLSGTFTQAWSLAEFIRTAHASYLGAQVDALNKEVWLRPRLPASIRGAAFTVPVGDHRLYVRYAGEGQVLLTSDIDTTDLSVNVTWLFPDGTERTVHVMLMAGESIDLTLTEEQAAAIDVNGDTKETDTQFRSVPLQPALKGLTLAVPFVRENLPSLSGPAYDLIPHGTIKADTTDRMTIVDIPDPAGDDVGTGTYTQPTTTYLQKGSMDLRRFSVNQNDSLVGFTLSFSALSDPGWHPEYGFQLTYCAIAIDTEPEAGASVVGRNAKYTLAPGREYERIIYVGGGIRVEDAQGHVLGAYVPGPRDEADPLGDAASGTISFSIPSEILGTHVSRWRFTVLVGAQDDHGGAGLGEFRSVEEAGNEWVGGGKRHSDDPNIYDVLEYPER